MTLRMDTAVRPASNYEFPARFDTTLIEVFERELARLRSEHGDVVRVTFPHGSYPSGNSDGWIALSYEASKFVFSDPRFGIAGYYDNDYPRVLVNPGARPPTPRGFASMDGPEHIRLRRVLARHISAKQTMLLRERVEPLLTSILDEYVKLGSGADLNEHYIKHVPLTVACELLGVPVEERERFVPAAHDLSSGRMKSEAEAGERIEVINAYFRELVARRRVDPGDDLLSVFMNDTESGNMSDDELGGLGFAVLFAGHDAPTVTMATMLHVLSHSPEMYQLLREQPELIPSAVEEFLRLAPAGAVLRPRIALEDVEAFGVTILKDEVIQPQVHSANYDTAVFDDPQSVNVQREPNPHVRFGFGAHACVGSLVARMELGLALEHVLSRFETLTAAVDPQDLGDWKATTFLRGPKQMPVNWVLSE